MYRKYTLEIAGGTTITYLSFFGHGRSLVGVPEAFLGDRDDNIVMGSLQEHLSLETNQPALLGAFQSSYQRLVILLDVIIVEQIGKFDFGRPPNSLNVSDKLNDFFV